jgi:hypothetical protein
MRKAMMSECNRLAAIGNEAWYSLKR